MVTLNSYKNDKFVGLKFMQTINVIVQHEYIAFNWTLTGWRASTWGLGERSAPLSAGHGPTAFSQIKSQMNLLI